MAKSIQRVLSVGEVAKRSGVAVSALHFYEAKGLISSFRSPGNQRRFPRYVLRQVAVIKAAQRLGIPLEDIKRAMADLPRSRPADVADWQALSARWKVELDARIDNLVRLRDQLTGCIGCGCLSLEVCPLRNPHDRLAEAGPGAPLLWRDAPRGRRRQR